MDRIIYRRGAEDAEAKDVVVVNRPDARGNRQQLEQTFKMFNRFP